MYSVPLNWHNKPDELAYVIGDSKPALIVGHADFLLSTRDAIPKEISIYVVPLEGKAASECTAVSEALNCFRARKSRTNGSSVLNRGPRNQSPFDLLSSIHQAPQAAPRLCAGMRWLERRLPDSGKQTSR